MKSALVTGASTGIGRACALDLAARGWRVFAGVRRAEDGDALVAACVEARPKPTNAAAAVGILTPVLLDVCEDPSVATCREQVEQELGGEALDALVNNAGIAVAGPLEYLPVQAFQTQLDVNLTGVLRVTQAFLPALRRSRDARIVMVSSISGRVATPMVGAYNASKFGLEGLSDALRRELLDHRIRVSVVQPGAIATAIWESSGKRAEVLRQELPAAATEHYGEVMQAIERSIPKVERRAIPAHKVARAIRHALEHARPRLRYVVGPDAIVARWFQRLIPARLFDRLIVRDVMNN